MQPLLVAAALLVVVGLAQAKFDHKEARKRFDKCREETGAEETYDETVKKQVMPTSEKGICLMECIMRANKAYKENGEYDLDAANQYFKDMLEGRPNADEQYEKMKEIISDCSKIDVKDLDKCEVAVKHSTCVKVKADKAGITLFENDEESSS